jgi:hypothetical protein
MERLVRRPTHIGNERPEVFVWDASASLVELMATTL